MWIRAARMSLRSQPTQALISMVRVTDAAGAPLDGTLPARVGQRRHRPSANFKLGIEGTRVATPGASPITRPDSTNTDGSSTDSASCGSC